MIHDEAKRAEQETEARLALGMPSEPTRDVCAADLARAEEHGAEHECFCGGDCDQTHVCLSVSVNEGAYCAICGETLA